MALEVQQDGVHNEWRRAICYSHWNSSVVPVWAWALQLADLAFISEGRERRFSFPLYPSFSCSKPTDCLVPEKNVLLPDEGRILEFQFESAQAGNR